MLSKWNVLLLKITVMDIVSDDKEEDVNEDVTIVKGICDVDEKGWPFGEEDNEENIDVSGRECWNERRFDLE